jgi:hypothetical protein
MAILTPGDYPQVRAAIDAELQESGLPDQIIGMDIYSGRADARVLQLDPDAETRTGTDRDHVRRAAIFFCAAYLVPRVVRATSVNTQTRDLSIQKNLYDPDKLMADLEAAANDEIAQVLTPEDTTPNRFTMFARSSGTRGK